MNKSLIVFLSIPLCALAFAGDECVFAKDAFSRDWITKHKLLTPYVWDEKDKSFGVVLSPNRYLKIIGGGCYDYGETYHLIIIDAYEIPRSAEWYKSQFIELGAKTLNKADLGRFGKQIENLNYESLGKIENLGKEQELASSTPYESFGMSVIDRKSTVEFFLSWYEN